MDATALVPFKDQGTDNRMEDAALSEMSLDDLLDVMVVPNEKNQPTVEWTFEALGTWYSIANTMKAAEKDIIAEFQEMMDIVDEVKRDLEWEEIKKSGKRLIRHVVEWTVKKILKEVIWRIIDYVVDAVIDVTMDVLEFSIRGMLDWLIRPVFMGVLDFIGLNPELWPFLALAGGVAALGWFIYDKLFSKHTADAQAIPDTLGTTTETSRELVTETQIAPQPTVAAQGQALVSPPTPLAPQPFNAPLATDLSGQDADVKKMIVRHEGIRTRPYKDSRGLWTVGVGHLIGNGLSLPPEWDREFTMEEVMTLFDKDFEAHKAIAERVPNFGRLNAQGQGAIIDMVYNMGQFWTPHGSSKGWPTWTKEMQDFDIAGAVQNMQGSLWAKQVGRRAQEVIALLATNIDPSKIAPSTTRITPGTSVANPQQQQQQTQQAAQALNNGAMQQPTDTNRQVLTGKNGELIALNM